MPNELELSICIVTWNSENCIIKCIESIVKNCSVIYEIIVIDNNSTDATVNNIRTKFKDVIIIENNQNFGFARAQNIGITKSQGIYTMILNPDILLIDNSFSQMINCFNKDPLIGVLSCKLKNEDGSIQKSYENHEISLMSTIIYDLLKLSKPSGKDIKHKSGIYEVSWVTGACMLFKSNFLKEELNGFDDRFFMYSEDADICKRVKDYKLKVCYTTLTEMIHYSGISSEKQKKSYFAPILQRESAYKLILKRSTKFSGSIYRLLWLIISILRLAIFSIYFVYTIIFHKKKIEFVIQRIIKYMRIISWSIGLEKWVKYNTPE